MHAHIHTNTHTHLHICVIYDKYLCWTDPTHLAFEGKPSFPLEISVFIRGKSGGEYYVQYDLCAQEGDVGGGAATGRRATSPGSGRRKTQRGRKTASPRGNTMIHIITTFFFHSFLLIRASKLSVMKISTEIYTLICIFKFNGKTKMFYACLFWMGVNWAFANCLVHWTLLVHTS